MKKDICRSCRRTVESFEEPCPYCGGMNSDSIHCQQHGDRIATGACMICSKPFCPECGKRRHGVYLCNDHGDIPVIEGLAGVFGGEDELHVRYLESVLKETGYHPHLYIRKVHPISTAFHMAGNLFEAQGRISNAILILVPFHEFMEVQKVLEALRVDHD